MRNMVFAEPVFGGDGYLVTLDCGHKMATRERRVAYHCWACEGPVSTASVASDPIAVAVAAERERCALIADAAHAEAKRRYDTLGERRDWDGTTEANAAMDTAAGIARRIRAQTVSGEGCGT